KVNFKVQPDVKTEAAAVKEPEEPSNENPIFGGGDTSSESSESSVDSNTEVINLPKDPYDDNLSDSGSEASSDKGDEKEELEQYIDKDKLKSLIRGYYVDNR